MTNRFLLVPAKGRAMGVCAGLARWLKVDVLAIRLAAIIATLVTGPVAVPHYILTGWLANDDR